MQIKTFEALNIKEAIKAVKAEFGQTAVILSTKEKVIDGDLKNKLVEVTAAVNEPSKQIPGMGFYAQPEATESKHLESMLSQMEVRFENISENLPHKNQLDALQSGLEELKLLYLESLKSREASMFKNLSKPLSDIYMQLKIMGVNEPYILQLVNQLKELPAPEQAGKTLPENANEYYQSHAIRWMLKRTAIAPSWEPPAAGSSSIHAFVGPSGVGKTSLIAKLAAHFTKRHHKRCLIVSCDNQRLAASDQLRLYSKIIGVPFTTVGALGEIETVMQKNRDVEMVFIDTAGTSPKNSAQIQALLPLKKCNLPIDVHLVLAITEKESQLDRAIRSFSTLGISSLIFSKLDESWSYGEIFNLSLKWSLPLSYFSLGQRIPEDVEKASRERVVERIFGL